MKDKRLDYIVAVLVLFLGFEISLFFTLLLDVNRNVFEFTIYFLSFEISLNTIAIISLYIYIVSSEKAYPVLYRFLHKFTSNLIFLSFTGIFGLLYYLSRDIRMNFPLIQIDFQFIETLFILCFIFLTFFIMFSYHFIEFYYSFTKKSLIAVIILESVLWIGFYITAFIWVNFFGVNNFVLSTFLILIFIIDLVYFSISGIRKKEITKPYLLILEYIIMLIINLAAIFIPIYKFL